MSIRARVYFLHEGLIGLKGLIRRSWLVNEGRQQRRIKISFSRQKAHSGWSRSGWTFWTLGSFRSPAQLTLCVLWYSQTSHISQFQNAIELFSNVLLKVVAIPVFLLPLRRYGILSSAEDVEEDPVDDVIIVGDCLRNNRLLIKLEDEELVLRFTTDILTRFPSLLVKYWEGAGSRFVIKGLDNVRLSIGERASSLPSILKTGADAQSRFESTSKSSSSESLRLWRPLLISVGCTWSSSHGTYTVGVLDSGVWTTHSPLMHLNFTILQTPSEHLNGIVVLESLMSQ